MDLFLNDVNVLMFKEWILNQKSSQYNLHIDSSNNNKIKIETQYCLGEIVFHPQNIIELSIINSNTSEPIFYLHFQMTSMKHAIDLFNEMIETLINLNDHTNKKILICCSSGLTSSYFASKINQAIEILSYDYTVQACSYTKLFEYAPSFDIILLAPQISYLQKEALSKINDKLILNIPSPIFAKYNVGELFRFVQDEYIKYNEKNIITNKEYLKDHILLYQHSPLLCISIYQSKDKICVLKTLIKHKDKLINELDLRTQFSLSDLINIIDSCLLQYHDIEKIHISLPGYIKDNKIVNSSLSQLENLNIINYLNTQYPKIEIFVENVIHCKSIGYHHVHSYKSIVYVHQYDNDLKCSIILDGKLIKGDSFIAGDLNYLPIKHNDFHHNNHFKFHDTHLIKSIVSLICILSPEIIIFNEELPYSINIIQEELAHYLPQEYIPKLKKSKHDIEYLLLGQMLTSN